MSSPPLDRLDELIPAGIRRIVERESPIPTIARRAAEVAGEHPHLVRGDIGQIVGFDADLEVLYGPPVGLTELRARIAAAWNHTFRLARPLTERHVAVTTGAAEALTLLFRCFAEGGVVGLPRGHWENYRNGVELAGGRIEVVDFFDGRGRLDTTGLARRARESGLGLLVANFPCNPTGAVLTESEAAELGAMIRELGLPVVADEVYTRLRYDGHRPVSLLEHAPRHVVAVSSASKEYLLPGGRVGYVVTDEPLLTDRVFRKLTRANTASPNVLGQRRLLDLLGADLADLEAGREPRLVCAVRDEMKRRRDALVETLEEHGFTLEGRAGHRPEGTIFLMAGVPKWWSGDDESLAEALLARGCVSAIPGSAFGLPGAIRLSFGSMTGDDIVRLGEGLAAFRRAKTG